MNRTLIVAALATLAGCTTAKSVSDGAPFFSGRTAKDQMAVAGCIAAAWGETKGFHARTERGDGVVSVILAGSSVAGVDMIANIHANGAVDMHRRSAAWGKLDDRLAAAVRDCL